MSGDMVDLTLDAVEATCKELDEELERVEKDEESLKQKAEEAALRDSLVGPYCT